MIVYKTGNLLREPADALVNTVNCVGVMGRGVALQFKKAFPKNYDAYRKACKAGEVVPGAIFVTERGNLTQPRFIFNFPTKRHWRGKSRMEDIEAGLRSLRDEIRQRDVRSIAIPPLGCGLGGLDWSEVRERIEDILHDLDVPVVVFEPDGAPDADVMARTSDVPSMTTGRATLVVLLRKYLDGLLDPFATLLELHKLMYFMQAGGGDLSLKYRKHFYGPYADNLRHVLNAIEGHMIQGYADGGDDPAKEIELLPGAFEDASAHIATDRETSARLERVKDLVSGFESPFGLELLATVHWVVREEGASTLDDAMRAVRGWNARKRRLFSDRQIAMAFERLKGHGWLDA